jgi:hypothetical protein
VRKIYLNLGEGNFCKSFLPPNPHLSKTFSSFGEKYIQPENREKKELIPSFRRVTAV